jgi:uncharacterized protein (DUF885 family)
MQIRYSPGNQASHWLTALCTFAIRRPWKSHDGGDPLKMALVLLAFVATGIGAAAEEGGLSAPPPTQSAGTAPASMLAVLDAEWQWRQTQFPENATDGGDHRFDDRLTDRSPAAVARRREHHRQFLAAIRAIDRNSLEGEERLSWDIFSYLADRAVREDELLLSMAPGSAAPWSSDDSPFSVNQMEGPQFELPMLVGSSRFESMEDYTHYLSRLQAFPASFQQLKDMLDAGRIAHVTPPQIALARVPGQFASLVNPDLDSNPLFAPFLQFPDDIGVENRAALSRSAEHLLHTSVIPSIARFRDYLVQTWIPQTRKTLGANDLPRGQEYYALAIERSTTLRKTPRELHDLGLKEVSRIDRAMQEVMKHAGFTGTLAEFRTFLRTDKRFQFASADEELVTLRDLAKRVDPQLPKLFAVLPRLPYGVRSMPPEAGNNAPHYLAGAIDGSRAGYFEANTNNLAAWPRWSIEALFLHEAVPGHHIQIARGQEISSLPTLRRRNGNYAFNEGWALYAEGLGQELGLYADPYTLFGRLSLDSLRACRLVVDTGLHSFGWSRAQAIDYLITHAQVDPGFAEAEVDRYLVWPGQALSYKVGEQEILALRNRAKAQLGSRFDIRSFHNAVIDHGSVPLPVLEHVIEIWIDSRSVPDGNGR